MKIAEMKRKSRKYTLNHEGWIGWVAKSDEILPPKEKKCSCEYENTEEPRFFFFQCKNFQIPESYQKVKNCRSVRDFLSQ